MSAILVYLPVGRLNRREYEGAIEQINHLKACVPAINELGTIDDESTAKEFVRLANEGKHVVAMIRARCREQALYELANFISDTDQSVHPSRVKTLPARERPMTQDEWVSTVRKDMFRYGLSTMEEDHSVTACKAE